MTRPSPPRLPELAGMTEEDIRKAREGASDIDAFFTFDPGKAKARELVRQFHDGELGEPTPLQRLLKFASDDGTPVSFEIAEKAIKGGG